MNNSKLNKTNKRKLYKIKINETMEEPRPTKYGDHQKWGKPNTDPIPP